MAMNRSKDFVKEPKEFEERIIQIKRVSKKTKGGNKIGFTALIVLGNRNGKVGAGLGKASDVSQSIQKAISKAKENMITVNMKGNTIPHKIEMKYGSSHLLMKPAPLGSGIIAGGTVRDVVELAGVKDITAKMLGSNNKNINVLCALEALKSLRESKIK